MVSVLLMQDDIAVTRGDICDVGNCWLCYCNTACVYPRSPMAWITYTAVASSTMTSSVTMYSFGGICFQDHKHLTKMTISLVMMLYW